ncbi:MAG: CdaR family protein [Clostridiales bacterium]|jgi:YbbR domain-containing protein|nr:CdaR family protein [Clostridiales bacterium]
MLNSRKSKIIISLVVAIALWVYVVGEMDPQIKKTFRSVPIKYVNEQALAEKGMAVSSLGKDQMSVTLSGKRSLFTRMDSEDLSAEVDLSNAAVGTNELSVELNVPSGLESTHQSVSKVVVKVERRISQKKQIRVSYLGNYASGEEPTTLSISPSSVTVSGAKSLVRKVSYIRATVQKSRLSGKAASVTASLMPVDSSGYEVKDVVLSQKTVHIRTALYKTKSVKLNVSVKDSSDDSGNRTYDAPDRVTIKGPQSKLADIDEIKSKPIDISDIHKDTTVKIEPILPDGVELASDSGNLTMTVNVKNGDYSKDFVFRGSDIEVNDLGSDYDAQILTDSVKVTVAGSSKQLSAVKKGDIHLSVGAGDLGEGTHEVQIEAELKKKYSELTLSPQTVSVKITKKSGD